MNRIKNVFNIDSITVMKISLILIIVFVLESLLWKNLNYYHRPNEIAMGNFIALLIFLTSCVLFFKAINRGQDKWALLIAIHIVGLFFIDRITLDDGWKRYLDSEHDSWKFHYDDSEYLIQRGKKLEYLTIYEKSVSYEKDGLYYPILSGKYFYIEKGWKLINDSLDISIKENKLIGFPTELDTIVIKKIYF